jgi:hypothetical protein
MALTRFAISRDLAEAQLGLEGRIPGDVLCPWH